LTAGNCPLPDVVRDVKTFASVQVPSVAVVEKTWLIDESLLVTLHRNPYQPVENTKWRCRGQLGDIWCKPFCKNNRSNNNQSSTATAASNDNRFTFSVKDTANVYRYHTFWGSEHAVLLLNHIAICSNPTVSNQNCCNG